MYGVCIRADPDEALSYHNRGLIKCEEGRYIDAIADFDKAIERKPDYVDAYLNRGTAQADLGEYPAAIAGL